MTTAENTEAPLVMSHDEWQKEASARFGDDPMGWRFVCPSCAYEAAVADWKKAGAPQSAVAFSCVGRWLGADDAHTFKRDGGPCQYAGGGLIGLNPVTVMLPDGAERHVFRFAD